VPSLPTLVLMALNTSLHFIVFGGGRREIGWRGCGFE
jgi:hypothetical protein